MVAKAPVSRPRAWACAGVAALLLLAFVERWIGIGHRLPQQREPDTAIVHQAALAAFSAWAVLGALWVLRSPSWRAYLGGGVACALALATLHSGFFVLPSFLVAHVAGWRRDRRAERWVRCACALALCSIAFVLAYPFLVFGDALQSSDTETLNFGEHAIPWRTWNARGIARMPPEA